MSRRAIVSLSATAIISITALALEGVQVFRIPNQVSQAPQVDVRSISFDLPAAEIEKVENQSEASAPSSRATYPSNRLIIPRMGVDADVIESDSPQALRKGLWHIPGSAFPGENGNIVISAHRWLHKPPSPKTFYLIDKLEVNDPIYYDFGPSRYEYRVNETFVASPEDVHILKQDENKLTLFTCTPLYSTKQRYVVTAVLKSVTPRDLP